MCRHKDVEFKLDHSTELKQTLVLPHNKNLHTEELYNTRGSHPGSASERCNNGRSCCSFIARETGPDLEVAS